MAQVMALQQGWDPESLDFKGLLIVIPFLPRYLKINLLFMLCTQ